MEYLVLYLLSNQKTSLQTGLDTFWEKMEWTDLPCSRQAFSKRRQDVDPNGILYLLRGLSIQFYENADYRTWNGKRLLAVDGSRYNLPCTEATQNTYGTQISQGEPQVQGLGSNLYDVLNGFILDSSLNPCKSNERKLFLAHLDYLQELHIPEYGAVLLLDRGYPSAELIHELEERKLHYVMRCSSEFIRSMTWNGNDCIVTHHFSKRKKEIAKFRMIHLPLGDSEEILITNLYDPTLGEDDFRELYHMRWGIESSYRTEKTFLSIENFSGETLIAIQQDYYATGFLFNMAQAIRFDMREDFDKAHNNGTNTLKYQQNLNRTIDELKKHVVKMIYSPLFFKGLELLRIRRNLLRATCAIQPGRSYPRKRKHKTSKFSKQYKQASS